MKKNYNKVTISPQALYQRLYYEKIALEEQNEILTDIIFRKCHRNMFYTKITIIKPCNDCGVAVLMTLFEKDNSRQIPFCGVCAGDIPF